MLTPCSIEGKIKRIESIGGATVSRTPNEKSVQILFIRVIRVPPHTATLRFNVPVLCTYSLIAL